MYIKHLSKSDAYDTSMVMGSWYYSAGNVKAYATKFIDAMLLPGSGSLSNAVLVIRSSSNGNYEGTVRENHVTIFSKNAEIREHDVLVYRFVGTSKECAKIKSTIVKACYAEDVDLKSLITSLPKSLN